MGWGKGYGMRESWRTEFFFIHMDYMDIFNCKSDLNRDSQKG